MSSAENEQVGGEGAMEDDDGIEDNIGMNLLQEQFTIETMNSKDTGAEIISFITSNGGLPKPDYLPDYFKKKIDSFLKKNREKIHPPHSKTGSFFIYTSWTRQLCKAFFLEKIIFKRWHYV